MTVEDSVTDTNNLRETSQRPTLPVWLGLCLGVGIVFVGVFLRFSPLGTFGAILIGSGFLIPSIWWLHCNSLDEKALMRFDETQRENQNLSRYLTDSERLVVDGLGATTPPRPKDRKWPLMATLSVALMLLGAWVLSVSMSNSDSPTESPAANDQTPLLDDSVDDPQAVPEEASGFKEGKLETPLSLSDKPDNDVSLTIHEITLGEACRYGEITDGIDPGFQYLQLTADFDVRELGSPTFDLGEMLSFPKSIDSAGFKKEADWASGCEQSPDHEEWNVILNSGEKARVYGAFIVPEDAEILEINGYQFPAK